MPDRYEYIVNVSKDFMTMINRDYVYEVVNDAYCRAIERSRSEIVGKTVAQVWGKTTFENTIRRYIDECFSGKEVQNIDRFRFGPFERHIHVTYYPFRGEGGEVTHAVVCSHDITRLSEVETKLSHFEFRDPTTGLYNRRSLDVILTKEIDKAARTQDKLRAVLFISVQHLGRVNEVHGIAVGDLILENTGLRVQKCLRAGDYVFRFVGNELTCLVTQIARAIDAAKIAAKIVEQIRMPYPHRDGDIRIGCAVGIAVYPDDGDTADAVIRHASSAMKQAIRMGADYVFYNPAIQNRASERMQLDSEMHRAFEKEQFTLVYQPIVDPVGRIQGAEALIRWNHPEKGLVPPGEFLPQAHEAGIMRSISKWALFTAAEKLAQWSARFPVFLTVNLSAEDFTLPGLAEILASAMQRSNLKDRASLKLEITESECMLHPEASLEQLTHLAKEGYDLLIDDFGTGNSSLAYLKRLPVGAVKIDRAFVEECIRGDDDFRYLAGIVALARSRRKRVILEGVATWAQYEKLLRLDVDSMQGYYFSIPVTGGELEDLLVRNERLPLPSLQG